MKRALWLAALALPLAAQPKLLINAQTDARSGAAGLEREFKVLLAAQPQPTWIGYSVPVAGGANLGCEYVAPEGGPLPGVIHLEPPGHMIALFRVEANAVERVRTLSPDCEIDAGGLPFHWLADVQPVESAALLAGLARGADRVSEGAVTALGLHADPAAEAALERLSAADQPESVRRRAIYWLGAVNSGRRFDILRKQLAGGVPEAVGTRAVAGLSGNKAPAATDFLISIASGNGAPCVRAQAVSALARKPEPRAVDAILAALRDDSDEQVRRRAVSALQSLPDGAGIPLLIQTARTNPNPAVRKQAMSSLSQSKDPRALNFLEETLKR